MNPATTNRLARGLGWFSIGLGLAELLMPRRVAGPLGLGGTEPLVRAYGGREIAAGLGALALSNPAPAIWSRVAGDLLDAATLTAGLRSEQQRERRNAGIALAAVAGVMLLDLFVAAKLSRA